MEVDPPTDELAAAQLACSPDAICTLNGLAPGSAITAYHRTQFVQAMESQLAQICGPLKR